MYLVSLYFDEKTEERIQVLINQVAEKTGNTFMVDGKVPPHMTVCEFSTKEEEKAIECLKKAVSFLRQMEVQFVSVGTFLPYVIFLAPVLDKELLNISLVTYLEISKMEDCSMSKYYQPFQWMPHATIGKKLSSEEMRTAFEVLQNQFGPFKGTITKIGLAKTNPYQDIAVFEL
jgi:2'-5' RNA ligase